MSVQMLHVSLELRAVSDQNYYNTTISLWFSALIARVLTREIAQKIPIFQHKIDVFLGLEKNSKESFLKKLQICMKIYDYKDETKDVKGKVSARR